MVPRILPYINFVVASAALSFQVGVLFPWHHTITEEFNELKSQQAKQLAEYHAEKASLINALHIKLDDVAKTITPNAKDGSSETSRTGGALKF
ncbi:hypothetical protein IAR55_004613 [Kwoniella newhampshirensis]|uniref:Uncharacterized protein n=1 Tax=Kwoniella newhampshirensis TaxID=1651941 RepID=A0AAW0YNW5_9TREE